MSTCYKPQHNSLEVLFNHAFDGFWRESSAVDFTPKADIQEEDDKFSIKMDMPGLDKKDVKIEIEDGYLVISGERKSAQEENKSGWLRSERSYGKFQRSFKLGGSVQEDAIKADFKNGELTLTLPKAEKAQKKQIAIN